MDKSEIRISKSEAKKEIEMSEKKILVWNLEFRSLEFVSDFGFRISIL